MKNDLDVKGEEGGEVDEALGLGAGEGGGDDRGVRPPPLALEQVPHLQGGPRLGLLQRSALDQVPHLQGPNVQGEGNTIE